LKIFFKDVTLQTTCEKRAVATIQLGAICAKKLFTRLADLEAATCVTDLVAGKPHPLKGDRLGKFAVSLDGGWRLVFVPANDPIPRHDDESVDWSQVTIVSIEQIVDYHD
jgi:proteic killer suppression protein